jgi:hypothetical protein
VIHDLKIWPLFFDEVVADRKRAEIRRDDRPFAVGDTLLLREWRPGTATYTGRNAARVITYISEPFRKGDSDDFFVVLSIAPVMSGRDENGAVNEVCPVCGTAHGGFTPRPGQVRSFWACRNCSAQLVTRTLGPNWVSVRLPPADDPATDARELRALHDYHRILSSFGTFLYHPLITDILALVQSAPTIHAFYLGLQDLHGKYKP